MQRASDSEREKRNFVRLKTDTPADVLVKRAGKRIRAVCRDLSGGGMSIETRVGIRPGVELEITLASHYGDSPMLRALTRVARARRGSSGNFILGLEILEMLD